MSNTDANDVNSSALVGKYGSDNAVTAFGVGYIIDGVYISRPIACMGAGANANADAEADADADLQCSYATTSSVRFRFRVLGAALDGPLNKQAFNRTIEGGGCMSVKKKNVRGRLQGRVHLIKTINRSEKMLNPCLFTI